MSTSQGGTAGRRSDESPSETTPKNDASDNNSPVPGYDDGQNPDPAETAGLEPGGGVQPGDTPPMSTSAAGPNHEPPQRTRAPAIVFLVAIGVIVVLIALGLVARIAGLF
ncbi:hypothetical protein ASG56_15075 [Rhodococcus sp. Leaf7]|uniref:DUF6480 family protein n=1 Tax=unclassified Rhodococcus (in: high G+C Gram-positive bacteria) TaxID=192944 RepID=UPI0005ABDCB6|nr:MULTISPECIES: DUF6480 family protein [unclassified Rhodococcus (in: high G+C Gram-positive bacteria)]KQU04631.1 hypothetical protein ASG56_15075 [Rhodococcus sp. Leaf7]KQU40816.1 hypothetical protein ASG64_15065 [Rhodococcus sp. Leaf247]